MRTPLEIDFEGMSARPDIRASIEHHVAALEKRCGRITACRVVVKAPGASTSSISAGEIQMPDTRNISPVRPR